MIILGRNLRRLATDRERMQLSEKEQRRLLESENRHRTMTAGEHFWDEVREALRVLHRKERATMRNNGLPQVVKKGTTVEEMLYHGRRAKVGKPRKVVTDWEVEYRKRNPSTKTEINA